MVAPKTARPLSEILSVVSGNLHPLPDVVQLIESFAAPERVELAEREANGISVVLYWARATNVLTVAVADATTGDYFELVLADDERPLDVFYHPFAYARARGLELADEQEPEVALDALDA
jgi:hypothetical protein